MYMGPHGLPVGREAPEDEAAVSNRMTCDRHIQRLGAATVFRESVCGPLRRKHGKGAINFQSLLWEIQMDSTKMPSKRPFHSTCSEHPLCPFGSLLLLRMSLIDEG